MRLLVVKLINHQQFMNHILTAFINVKKRGREGQFACNSNGCLYFILKMFMCSAPKCEGNERKNTHYVQLIFLFHSSRSHSFPLLLFFRLATAVQQ